MNNSSHSKKKIITILRKSLIKRKKQTQELFIQTARMGKFITDSERKIKVTERKQMV